ncbi:hypothetical protein ACIA5G_42060 [Amycolatopsis sp. NPDC051758]|uniref:hypothetical protein n=1 Tax=Amycolatopsis sp. NPDC051758 TaxID=3363935 RepID=UPI00379FEFDE
MPKPRKASPSAHASSATSGHSERTDVTPDNKPGKLARVITWIVEEFSTIAVLVSAAVVAIGNRIGKLNEFSGPALFAIFIALSIRVLQIKYQLSNISAAVDKKSDEVRADFSALKGLFESDRMHEAEMCDREGFYSHMLSALRAAGRSVDLTQLDAYPPKHYGTPEMVEYFQLQTKMVRDFPGIKFRRIVAIPTLEKLEWTIDILDKVKDCPNFQINLIDISRSADLPPPLSLQIFDHKEMCLVDPTLGFMLPEDQRHMLWVRGSGVCGVFSVYYDSLWNLAQRVKEGSIIYWPVLHEVHRELATRHPEKRALADKIATRISRFRGRAETGESDT